ncbi:MAG: sulfite exporter TauE/SafE family protein [Gammaproteobacteria bacterium SHHR-1]|uniref:sulfite exporter TauE/SafE family protein n=1 Tax=Magnetovirga frankeli TaxID=947516 RepID=UPI0012930B1D|nr:sulfite exporter TauE/SafE family protein [gamma proteobacterium SS-5]
MNPELFLIYPLIGMVSGVIAGLLGVGGGLVLVPVLMYSFRLQGYDPSLVLHLALGTSLAVIVFNALSSIRAHQQRGAIRWELFAQLTPGLLLGTLLGSLLAAQLNTLWLQRIFGTFALLVGLQMLLMVRASGRFTLPGAWGQGLAGGLVGLVSALVGIGGGSMTVPYLSACRVDLRQAVATSAACGLPIALGGTLGYLYTGWSNPLLPAQALGYVHGPALLSIALLGMLFAPLGARLAHSLPVLTLKRLFGLLLVLLGARMLFSAGL